MDLESVKQEILAGKEVAPDALKALARAKLVEEAEHEYDFYMFEPKTFGEKLTAFRQNLSETFILVGIMIAGLYNSSAVACAMFLISCLVQKSIFERPDKRVKQSLYI